MAKTTISLLAFLIPMTATAEFLWSPAFDSADDAATSALYEAVYMASQHDEPVEYCGLIYEIKGRYFFTVPKSNGEQHQVLTDIQWPAKIAKLAGVYHNHTSGQGTEEFSSIDVWQAISLDVPTYISIADEGHAVRKWNPDDRGSLHYRYGLGNPQTRGELVSDSVVDVMASR